MAGRSLALARRRWTGLDLSCRLSRGGPPEDLRTPSTQKLHLSLPLPEAPQHTTGPASGHIAPSSSFAEESPANKSPPPRCSATGGAEEGRKRSAYGVVSPRRRFWTLAGGVVSAGAAVTNVKSVERVTLPPRSTETAR